MSLHSGWDQCYEKCRYGNDGRCETGPATASTPVTPLSRGSLRPTGLGRWSPVPPRRRFCSFHQEITRRTQRPPKSVPSTTPRTTPMSKHPVGLAAPVCTHYLIAVAQGRSSQPPTWPRLADMLFPAPGAQPTAAALTHGGSELQQRAMILLFKNRIKNNLSRNDNIYNN